MMTLAADSHSAPLTHSKHSTLTLESKISSFTSTFRSQKNYECVASPSLAGDQSASGYTRSLAGLASCSLISTAGSPWSGLSDTPGALVVPLTHFANTNNCPFRNQTSYCGTGLSIGRMLRTEVIFVHYTRPTDFSEVILPDVGLLQDRTRDLVRSVRQRPSDDDSGQSWSGSVLGLAAYILLHAEDVDISSSGVNDTLRHRPSASIRKRREGCRHMYRSCPIAEPRLTSSGPGQCDLVLGRNRFRTSGGWECSRSVTTTVPGRRGLVLFDKCV